MDNLQESFGRLSTAAREWRPPNHQQAPPIQQSSSGDWHQESELSATAVKEFVPGRGWSTQTKSSGSTNSSSSSRAHTSSGQWGGRGTSGEYRDLLNLFA